MFYTTFVRKKGERLEHGWQDEAEVGRLAKCVQQPEKMHLQHVAATQGHSQDALCS